MNLQEITTAAKTDLNDQIKGLRSFEFFDVSVFTGCTFFKFKFTTKKYSGTFSYSGEAGTRNGFTIWETETK